MGPRLMVKLYICTLSAPAASFSLFPSPLHLDNSAMRKFFEKFL